MSKDEYKDTVRRAYDEFGNLGRNLEEAFGQVKSATPAYFDVNIKSLADTQDYLGQYGNTARDPDALRQEFYGFKPAQERFRQWEGLSVPYYRDSKGTDPTGGKESEGLDGLAFARRQVGCSKINATPPIKKTLKKDRRNEQRNKDKERHAK